jgi:glycine/D-amino acid oxidase-like deaminating enzyme
MIEAADVVVIGSGALGSSIAFHLARAGLGVALVDQHAIASQTSPRAAGLTAQVRGDALMTRLAVQGVRKIEAFAAETGEPMLYHQSGSLKIARRPEDEAQLRDEVDRGKALGVPIDFVGIDEARQRMPFLTAKGVRAVTFTSTDLYLEPGQIASGYARAAARLGATLLPKTLVTGITLEDGCVEAVMTEEGPLRAPVIVDAAGAWARMVAGMAGNRVGMVPTRHQLFVTEPIAGVEAGQPITRVIDCNVYIRPDRGGLMLGGYERNPVQYDMDEVGAGFSIADLALDVGVLRGLAHKVRDQFPVLEGVAIREHRGGLPTMTPDGHHVVGPVPDVEGLWIAGGCCVGGLSVAPAIGEILADWIVSGQSSLDLAPLSPARAAINDLPENRLRDLCRSRYAHHYWSETSHPLGAA